MLAAARDFTAAFKDCAGRFDRGQWSTRPLSSSAASRHPGRAHRHGTGRPKGLGYAEIAGVPIEHGLYACAAGTIIYALLGTSRQISTGPSSALSAVAGSALLAAGASGQDDPVGMVTAIALVAGLLFAVLALLRMGWISQFISRAVIVGFLFGAAIDVAIGELPKITGTTGDGDNAWQETASWVSGLADTQPATLVVGVAALLVLFGLHVVAPRLPEALVAVVGGLVASALLDLESRGVALVGEVPRGVPVPALPDPSLVRREPRGDRGRRRRHRADRVLAERRRCALLRHQERLRGGHQPGVARAGHGERRVRALPGHPGVHEPVGELAQRPCRARRARWPR